MIIEIKLNENKLHMVYVLYKFCFVLYKALLDQ